MDKENKNIYKRYFGIEPKINIKIDDAEMLTKILAENIVQKKYRNIEDMKKDIKILDNIKKEIKNIEETITEIYNG